ncbi:unnamed protein product [Linum trigynum]|uniref:Uncharacterized protein n=1 Tax=Linum trigynum TaxID=586398 RepID=A0AAV2CJN7_9ROSI
MEITACEIRAKIAAWKPYIAAANLKAQGTNFVKKQPRRNIEFPPSEHDHSAKSPRRSPRSRLVDRDHEVSPRTPRLRRSKRQRCKIAASMKKIVAAISALPDRKLLRSLMPINRRPFSPFKRANFGL